MQANLLRFSYSNIVLVCCTKTVKNKRRLRVLRVSIQEVFAGRLGVYSLKKVQYSYPKLSLVRGECTYNISQGSSSTALEVLFQNTQKYMIQSSQRLYRGIVRCFTEVHGNTASAKSHLLSLLPQTHPFLSII